MIGFGVCWIVSRTFRQQYGYFEIRCKIPSSPGAWPAVWMMSDDDPWPPEIDVFEFYTSETQKSTLHSTIHWPEDEQKAKENRICDASKSFNIYGLEWAPEYMRWFFNNNLIRTEVFHMEKFIYPLYVIVNGAMEDYVTTPSKLNGTLLPHVLEVDYVRVYKKI